ncbi:hypothetical protein GCM10022198_04130 [Klugiella xanthotipulae]|uniref:Uncharacterized protein n=1 Tax=Klugiella xanthotipulae TaxID=244735 RepID=A0A543HSL1_9MICO|nr:DUF6704 family protein [Klugiella xanthotipulae]TQM61326.1 hypothetical protein FB466_2276 [Klugiella xanthotipulae]
MSIEHEEPGHGDSPAAWTAVVLMLIGMAAGTVAFFMHQPMIVLACAGLVVVGPLVGFIMSKAGYGVNGPKYVAKAHN